MFSSDIFKGQTVLVSGGGSGIGYEISEQFLKHGATVFIASRTEERLVQAVDKLSKLGECHYVVADIRNIEDVQRIADVIEEVTGGLHILVNNAGGQFPSPAKDISLKGWNAVIDNNLNGTWYMTQVMANRFFIPGKDGKIVNIIANIYRGFPGMAHTGAARAGVDNLTKSLAVEWAPYHINVNCVAPGVIHTTGLDQYPPGMLDHVANEIPMKRFGTSKEVADMTLFLASPYSKYVTGETLYVDGGMRLSGDIWKVPT